ncbi:hypothetical protein APV28_2727 [Comamonas testosteroni]|nr:hypothetical protein APV28_2727 [Comamonas testosteroni]
MLHGDQGQEGGKKGLEIFGSPDGDAAFAGGRNLGCIECG